MYQIYMVLISVQNILMLALVGLYSGWVFIVSSPKNPDFPRPRKTPIFPIPETLQSLGMGTARILGIFWVCPQNFQFFGAEDRERAFKDFGDALGTGKPQVLGIFWGKIPKKPQKTGQGRGKDSRGFCPA